MIVMMIAITPSLNASSLVLDTVYPRRLGDGASAAKDRPLAWLLSGRVCSGALGKATGQVRWGTGVWMSAFPRAGVGRRGPVIKVAAVAVRGGRRDARPRPNSTATGNTAAQ
jgi:hypothetical protein